jgi:NAD(P)-dependent dehydrogenase (short-subunit alcohol dehydrogenase family)
MSCTRSEQCDCYEPLDIFVVGRLLFGNFHLVAAAGVMIVSPVENLPDEHWDQTIALMLTAPFHLTKRCLPSMKKKGTK